MIDEIVRYKNRKLYSKTNHKYVNIVDLTMILRFTVTCETTKKDLTNEYKMHVLSNLVKAGKINIDTLWCQVQPTL